MPPKLHPACLLALAVCLLSAAPRTAHTHGAPDDKIRILSGKIAREPANVDLLIKRGDLYRENGELSRARDDYERALRLDPSRDIIHLALALTFTEQGNFALALQSADSFIDGDPDNPRAWRARAHALSALGRPADAIISIERATVLADPPSPDDYLQRAALLASLGYNDAAITGLDEGLARLGPAVTLQLLAIDLERKRRTFDAALARLDQIQPQYVHPETLLALRGDVLAEAGRSLEADVAYTDALQIIEERSLRGPTTAAARRLRAELALKLGY